MSFECFSLFSLFRFYMAHIGWWFSRQCVVKLDFKLFHHRRRRRRHRHHRHLVSDKMCMDVTKCQRRSLLNLRWIWMNEWYLIWLCTGIAGQTNARRPFGHRTRSRIKIKSSNCGVRNVCAHKATASVTMSFQFTAHHHKICICHTNGIDERMWRQFRTIAIVQDAYAPISIELVKTRRTHIENRFPQCCWTYPILVDFKTFILLLLLLLLLSSSSLSLFYFYFLSVGWLNGCHINLWQCNRNQSHMFSFLT